MAKHSKRYNATLEKVDRLRFYSPEEAITLVKETANAKFDETVEVHLRMGVDPRYADQQVRGVVTLPNGTGRQVRILVFTGPDGAALAQEAGADLWVVMIWQIALQRGGLSLIQFWPLPT